MLAAIGPTPVSGRNDPGAFPAQPHLRLPPTHGKTNHRGCGRARVRAGGRGTNRPFPPAPSRNKIDRLDDRRNDHEACRSRRVGGMRERVPFVPGARRLSPGAITMVEDLLSRLAMLQAGEYLFFVGAALLALQLLHERRWAASAVAVGCGLLWLSLHYSVSEYLKSLSADSFAEARDFDLQEALFWWRSLLDELHPMFPKLRLVLYTGVALSVFGALRWGLHRFAGVTARAYARVGTALAALLMTAGVYATTAEALSGFAAKGNEFAQVARNFDRPAPATTPARRDLDLYVYIGESTSVMNLGLYGYLRDTTPRLSRLQREDEGLLAFRHVLSTHVHTSQSLLEALSLGVDPREDVLPITQRKRHSLPRILLGAGVQTRLMSNQREQGTYEQAASILFRDSRNTFRMAQDRAARRTGASLPSRWDDEFFAAELARDGPDPPGPRVTFLHSYAGHGYYLDHIPPAFHQPVDALLSGLPRAQIGTDPPKDVSEWIDAYDSAMRYVDQSVAAAIGRVRQRPWPAVLVYFSDHGDSVFTGRAHDSARFRHEMARVPFLLYFNEAARREHRMLFERYQALASTGEVATLAQLPATLLDLLGIALQPASASSGWILTPVVGERIALSPILVREKAGTISLIRLGRDPVPPIAPNGARLVEQTDQDTRLFLGVRSGRIPPDDVCVGVPRSLEESARRTLIADCPPAGGISPASVSSARPAAARTGWATAHRN